MSGYGDYPVLKSVRRALVVKLRHHGDVLLSSPVFSTLKQALPDTTIDAYVYKETVPMLDGHPAISEFHTCERNWKQLSPVARMRKELSVLNSIRECGYDLVINLTEGDRGAIVARYSKAPIRVGFAPKGKSFASRLGMLTHIVKRPPTVRHAVESNLDALRRIGIFPEPEERELSFTIPLEARERANELLLASGLADQKFVMVHPTSRWLFKTWPEESMAALIDQLAEISVPVVVTAAPETRERTFVARIVEGLKRAKVVDLTGQLTLKELGAVIDRSACLLTLDSVPAHIASALKKPTVVLFGPSSEIEWGPWRNPHARVIAQPMSCRPCGLDGCGGSKVSDCLHTLPVRPVLDAVLQLYSAQR